MVNKGGLCEAFVGMEILKNSSVYQKHDLYYWHREKRASNAEVDYIFGKSGVVYPIEVKSGTKGVMQSMRIFLKERNLEFGYRISFENFVRYDDISVVPIYAVKNVLK